jgi:hypothetical protein
VVTEFVDNDDRRNSSHCRELGVGGGRRGNTCDQSPKSAKTTLRGDSIKILLNYKICFFAWTILLRHTKPPSLDPSLAEQQLEWYSSPPLICYVQSAYTKPYLCTVHAMPPLAHTQNTAPTIPRLPLPPEQ